MRKEPWDNQWARISAIAFFGMQQSTNAGSPRAPCRHYDEIARILTELGRSNLHQSLSSIQKSIDTHQCDAYDDVAGDLKAACASVIAMRDDLVSALGLRERQDR